MTVPTTEEDYSLRDPDVALMLQVRNGSSEAFATLMNAYQDRVLAILFHLLGDRQLAEDLTQEAFLRVYRARHGYRPRAKFSTWLYTIVNNLASNALRRKSRSKEVPLNVRDSGPLGPRPAERLVQAKSGQMPTRQLEKAERAEIVRLAIGQLNERQRMAVLLNKFEDMSYLDIGSVMSMTPMAIKSLLSRARTNLREALEPYMQ